MNAKDIVACIRHVFDSWDRRPTPPARLDHAEPWYTESYNCHRRLSAYTWRTLSEKMDIVGLADIAPLLTNDEMQCFLPAILAMLLEHGDANHVNDIAIVLCPPGKKSQAARLNADLSCYSREQRASVADALEAVSSMHEDDGVHHRVRQRLRQVSINIRSAVK